MSKGKKKLKVIPLGGLGEIGKNITVFEYGNDILVVDCGMAFPDDEMLGIDLVLPDTTYLVKNKDRVKGIVVTHGHEDHIGALPYTSKWGRFLNLPYSMGTIAARAKASTWAGTRGPKTPITRGICRPY